ncbi:glycosyltransferase [Streptococcus porcinus]
MNNFSIAMAVFNGEEFLDKQLQSIIPQLREEDELVISYDLSSDNTFELIMRYASNDSRIKVFINPNSGLFSNFSNALSHCINEIIFISDQDDIWKLNKCEVILGEFEKYNSDMIIHNGFHFNSLTGVKSLDFFRLYGIKKGLLNNFIKPRYSGCCMAFKKELLNKMLPIPSNVGAYDHWLGMVGEFYGNLQFLNDILIEHRLHTSNFTKKNRRDLPTILSARLHLLNELMKRK